MTQAVSSKPASPGDRGTRPDFASLVRLRAEWRRFHERQDRDNAEAVFRTAGVGLVTDLDLKFLPHLLRAKLNEFGRDWERALAAQALRERYSFYRAQMGVAVDDVGPLQLALDACFSGERDGRPLGASLFFESNGIHAIQDGVWDCLFYFAVQSDVDPSSIGLERLPGVRSVPNTLRIA
jgi:hypothetical protein